MRIIMEGHAGNVETASELYIYSSYIAYGLTCNQLPPSGLPQQNGSEIRRYSGVR